jgi:excisionase family DNA binding protein
VTSTVQLHGVKETASRIGVSSWTVKRLIKRGKLRSVRIGRPLLISEREIRRVVRCGCGAR